MIIYAPEDCSFGWSEATPTSISVCCRRAALREIRVEIEIVFVRVCVFPNASVQVWGNINTVLPVRGSQVSGGESDP